MTREFDKSSHMHSNKEQYGRMMTVPLFVLFKMEGKARMDGTAMFHNRLKECDDRN